MEVVLWLKEQAAAIGLYTTNDYILFGAMLAGCFIILLSHNAYLEYKYFRYY